MAVTFPRHDKQPVHLSVPSESQPRKGSLRRRVDAVAADAPRIPDELARLKAGVQELRASHRQRASEVTVRAAYQRRALDRAWAAMGVAFVVEERLDEHDAQTRQVTYGSEAPRPDAQLAPRVKLELAAVMDADAIAELNVQTLRILQQADELLRLARRPR